MIQLIKIKSFTNHLKNKLQSIFLKIKFYICPGVQNRFFKDIRIFNSILYMYIFRKNSMICILKYVKCVELNLYIFV